MLKPQLFILHYAGGNVYSFNFMLKHLEQSFEVICIELPGRGMRMNEALIRDRNRAVQDQVEQIQKHRKKEVPYLLFGHSMGAILAYEVTSFLDKDQSPEAIVVTGNAGPGVYSDKIRYNLKREDFILYLKELGGMPDAVFENEELYNFFEPILRADFELFESVEGASFEKINCPIHCAMGSNEKYVHSIDNWSDFTRSTFHKEVFEGNHFFINDHPFKLSKFIKKTYDGTLAL